MPPRRWSRRATPRVAAKPPTALPGCTPEDQVLRLTCALCAREARGFGYIHQLRIGEFPHYRFCSMPCSKAGSALARRMGGMIDKTPLEEAAIKAARDRWQKCCRNLACSSPFTALARNQHRDMLRHLGAARDTLWIAELTDSMAERNRRAIWGAMNALGEDAAISRDSLPLASRGFRMVEKV
jgi:hypothetical protein